jgi:hypothetical protein
MHLQVKCADAKYETSGIDPEPSDVVLTPHGNRRAGLYRSQWGARSRQRAGLARDRAADAQLMMLTRGREVMQESSKPRSIAGAGWRSPELTGIPCPIS